MTTTWDAKDITCLIGGIPITGFADGSFATIAYNTQKYTLTIGADGESTRNRINNNSAVITITLMHQSVGNAVLDAFMKADDAANLGKFPFAIYHKPSGTGFVATEAWVQKDPGQDIQPETQGKAWAIETADLKSKHLNNEDWAASERIF